MKPLTEELQNKGLSKTPCAPRAAEGALATVRYAEQRRADLLARVREGAELLATALLHLQRLGRGPRNCAGGLRKGG